MRSLNQWLTEYAESHTNPINKQLHWVCVPLILLSMIGGFWHVSPIAALVFLGALLAFYAKLSFKLLCAMCLLLLTMLWCVYVLPVGGWFYLGVFVLAWAGQFYGHKLEGKKPSFFKDILFLGVGPAWCMDALLNRYLPRWWRTDEVR